MLEEKAEQFYKTLWPPIDFQITEVERIICECFNIYIYTGTYIYRILDYLYKYLLHYYHNSERNLTFNSWICLL